jgi:hypothetical protein
LAGLLAVAIGAVIAGARSFVVLGEWAGAISADSLTALGLSRPPGESNLRKVFARLDPVALDLALAAYAWTRVRVVQGRRVIAIDGKTVRGARSAKAAAPYLVAALDHASGAVVGQIRACREV